MIDSFVEKYNNSPEELFEVGRGGSGIVYLDPDKNDVLFKLSLRSNSCRAWNKEYRMYEKMKINEEKNVKFHSDLAEIIKVYEYTTFVNASGEDGCIMSLQRVYPLFENKHQRSVHALFGVESSDSLHINRGYFYGLKQISSYIEDISSYVFELGRLLSYLHYVLKNDGYDIEVIIGRETENGKIKLFIIDFDLSEELTTYDTNQIKRMVHCIAAVPYFPMPDHYYYSFFKKGYLEFSKDGIGELVLKEYEEIWE